MEIQATLRNSIADHVGDRLDGGTLQLATDGTFGTILLSCNIPNPSASAASGGAITLNLSGTASGTGNAEAYRYRDSSNAVLAIGTSAGAVSATGGGGEVVLNQASTAVVSGQEATLTATFTMPAGSP